MRTVPADSRLPQSTQESILPASKTRQSQVNVLRQGHPQTSVLSECKPEAQHEVSTATLRALMPGGHRLAPTESGDETERERALAEYIHLRLP